MKSSELAGRAGVTVRALRHYHQIGLLAEPRRRHNGYREYDVHDLIRILRIRRLATLGIPLERMHDLLDDRGDTAAALLDDLDAELADQISRLTAQRELIASLRVSNAAPDLPPELAPFLAAFAAAGLPPDLARIDRDQSVLLAHLAGADGMPHLTRFYERLSAPGLAAAVTALSERFGRLGPDSTDSDIGDLVEDFATTFAVALDDFAALDPAIDFSAATDLVSQFTTDLLNEQQRRALDLLEVRMTRES